jgi:hypothetical protein
VANQAIALQARAPQTDFMGRAIQQNAQMINMMSQQRAAERQNAIAQLEMEIARAGEARAAAGEERKILADQLDIDSKRATMLKSELGLIMSGDVAATNAWVQRAGALLPAWKDFLPPAETIAADRNVQLKIAGTIEQIINKEVATPVASVQIGEDRKAYSLTAGGFNPGVTPLMVGGGSDAAPAAPASAFAATATPATEAQIDAAAQKILRGAGVGELGIGAEDFDRASERANQLSAGGGRMQPISMMTGPQMGGGQPDLAAVVQDMMQTKQVTESNRRMMLDVLPPESAAQFDQILKAQNIRTVPDAEPSMRSAVFRPGEDAAPQMQQVQATNAPGTQFRVAKDPMQSPLPGSAQVPITRVRQQAQAERESPQEAAAKAAAVARANAAAEAEAKRAQKQPGQKNVSTIIGKMRSAYEQLNKMEAIPSEARGGGANFMDYMAVTRGGREVQKMFGTGPSKYLSQIETLRKQLATAIKNATGMSAQEMNSNVELQLTLDSLSDPTQGIEAALTTMADLEELYGLPKPAAGKPKTPTRTSGGATVTDW